MLYCPSCHSSNITVVVIKPSMVEIKFPEKDFFIEVPQKFEMNKCHNCGEQNKRPVGWNVVATRINLEHRLRSLEELGKEELVDLIKGTNHLF